MKSIILFFCLCGLVSNLFGQNNSLILTRKKHHLLLSSYPIVIQPSAQVKVKSNLRYGKILKGHLEIPNDSTLIIGPDSISIYNIKKIMVKSTYTKIASPFGIILGGGMTSFGILCLHEGVTEAGPAYGLGYILAILFIPSGTAAIYGGMTGTLNGDTFVARKWNIRVIYNYKKYRIDKVYK
jgi:hypothetical protein